MCINKRYRRLQYGFLSIACLYFTVFSDGLPGEYLITQRWRDLLAGHSCLQNPAFLTDENYPTVRAAYSRTLQTFDLLELGYTHPIGLYQSIGVSWFFENDGDVMEGDIASSGQLGLSNVSITNQNHFFILSYAINPINRLSLGANVDIAYQTNFNHPKYGVGLDVGLAYRLLRHPILGNHTVGAMFQNVVPPKLSVEDDSRYAVNLKFSWLMKFWEQRIESGFDIDLKDLYSQSKDFTKTVVDSVGGGVQYGVQAATKHIEFDFNYRIGFWLLRMIKAYFQAGSQFWGVAGGMNVPTMNDGRDLMFLYQYMNVIQGKESFTHSLYALAEIGKHREEVYARKMARLANIMPNELYNRACKLYYAGKYWDAFFIYGQIVSKFPDFFKNDWVEYYRGSCLEEMDMRVRSNETYEEMKKKYPRSTVVPMSDLGIMRIKYRNDDHVGVGEQFDYLNTSKVPDSLKYHAYYIMGESNLKQKQYAKATQLFDLIPENHPEYVFAQHSMAVANIIENKIEDAMSNLENCLQAEVKTEAQKEVANRSCLFLGYLYYEENSLSKAVTALRLVNKVSYYYEDALLGMGWTAIKARQWSDCLSAGRDLGKITNKPELRCEAALIESYGLLMQKNYPEAARVLKNANDILATLSGPSKDSLASRRRDNEQDRTSYEFLSREVKNVSILDQSSTVLKIIDSLGIEQVGTHDKLKKYARFIDEFGRREFFSRGIDKVRDDIEYALAVVMKLISKTEAAEIQQEVKEKQESIDDEIEKLKREMEELEKGKGDEEQ